eukprot:gene27651-36461_t
MGCGMAKLSHDDIITKSTIATQDGKSIDSNNREVSNDHLEIYKRELDSTLQDGKYDGDMDVKGRKHGRGVFIYQSGDIYDGEWMMNQKHGMGTYTMSNGDKYIGEFNLGIRWGKGRYEFASGAVYEGDFRANKMHGTGVFTFSDGIQYKGEFEDGVFHGSGHLLEKGVALQGTWSKGSLVTLVLY